MIRPLYCPYCHEVVEDIHKHRIQSPPDERNSYSPAIGGKPAASGRMTFDVVDCYRLDPCNHLFRVKDMKAVEEGDVYAHELGERVLNPGQ